LTTGPAKATLISSLGSKKNSLNDKHAPNGKIHILFKVYSSFFAIYACPNSCKIIAMVKGKRKEAYPVNNNKIKKRKVRG
jgi:hypothetical protein